MAEQPDPKNSAIISAFLFLLTLFELEVFSGYLASTPQLTILGGFISSLLFLFLLLLIGNLEKETSWMEVISSLLVAMFFAGTVHRVCVTTCFLFSIGQLAYLNYISKRIHKKKSN